MTDGTSQSRSIEDQIVQYFDGGLSDRERAELLHRASVSPEIRALFSAHESLRAMAQSAMLSTTISPMVEERLLAGIERLAAGTPTSKKRFWFWKAPVIRYGLAAVLVGAVSFSIARFSASSGDHSSSTPPSSIDNRASASNSASSDVGERANLSRATPLSGGLGSGAGVGSGNSVLAPSGHSSRIGTTLKDSQLPGFEMASTQRGPSSVPRALREHAPLKAAAKPTISTADAPLASSTIASSTIASATRDAAPTSQEQLLSKSLTTVSPRMAVAHPVAFLHEGAGLNHIRPMDIDNSASVLSRFELGLQTSSGFSYPASGPNVTPFADQRFTLDYLIDEANLVGVRLTSGLFQTLPTVQMRTTTSAVVLSRNLVETRQLSEELFYGHRFMLSSNSGLAIEASVGAGLIPNGNTITLELGFKMPMSSHLMGSFGFALSRVHSDAPSMDALLESEFIGSNGTPVILSGSNIRNTLNGRLEYGLSYRF